MMLPLVVCRVKTLAFAWTLAVVCYAHHLGHFLHALGLHEHAHTGFMAMIGNPAVSGVLGAAALLGPGRTLLVDGAAQLAR
jgi:Cu2+-exporting ATPase